MVVGHLYSVIAQPFITLKLKEGYTWAIIYRNFVHIANDINAIAACPYCDNKGILQKDLKCALAANYAMCLSHAEGVHDQISAQALILALRVYLFTYLHIDR